MNKVIDTQQAITLSNKLRKQGKTIVLVGGCFDILHIGHLTFLQKAKEQGDILCLLLESDEFITRAKGQHRPINHQKDRALLLAALEMVDYIIPLSTICTDQEYEQLVLQLKPAIIATTKGDPYAAHKKRQAQRIDGTLVEVTEPIANKSTSRIAQLIEKDL